MEGPDPRRTARREVVAAIIGAEVGAGVGVLVFGSTPLAPLALAAFGAGAGASIVGVRHVLIRRWLRSQLRAAP